MRSRRLLVRALVAGVWIAVVVACKPIPSAAPILDDEDAGEAAAGDSGTSTGTNDAAGDAASDASPDAAAPDAASDASDAD